MFLLAFGLANGNPNNLTLDTLKLKDAVAATVPWKTFS